MSPMGPYVLLGRQVWNETHPTVTWLSPEKWVRRDRKGRDRNYLVLLSYEDNVFVQYLCSWKFMKNINFQSRGPVWCQCYTTARLLAPILLNHPEALGHPPGLCSGSARHPDRLFPPRQSWSWRERQVHSRWRWAGGESRGPKSDHDVAGLGLQPIHTRSLTGAFFVFILANSPLSFLALAAFPVFLLSGFCF